MSSALRESSAAFPHTMGEATGGQWMVLVIGHSFYQSDGSKETTVYNGGCHTENVGEQCGTFSVKHCSTAVFCLSVSQSQIYSRQTVRGLSVLMKAYLPETEYTQPTHAEQTC